jgi:acetyl esterase/lipase
MKTFAMAAVLGCLIYSVNHGVACAGQQSSQQAERLVIPLWPGVPPGSKSSDLPEAVSHVPRTTLIRNVTKPTLTAFLPEPSKATGTAVIVAPGGAFIMLAIDHEGYDVAKWLADRGVAAFVLKYRVAQTPSDESEFQKMRAEQMRNPALLDPIINAQAPLSIADGKQAIKLVRSRAAEWGISPKRIGILGFSAGGGVTSAAALEYKPDERPDFAAPIYGARESQQVPADAPPLFLVAAADDDAVPASRIVGLFSRWQAAGKSAELHVYAQGGHGFGLYPQGMPSDHWIEAFYDWMQAQGFAKP